MKIFISYSFRPENSWVRDFVIPLVTHFGHEPVTGELLDAGPLDEEVKKKIRSCRRTICFVTRATPRYAAGSTTPASYEPPDWVRDELMLARGAERLVTEFRETMVEYGGAAPFHGYKLFDRNNIAKLMLDVAETISQWPVGPIQLRLSFPDDIKQQILAAANAGNLWAKCTAIEDGQEVASEDLPVRPLGNQLIVLYWIKAKPNYAIDIVVPFGAKNLAHRGISPVVSEAMLIAG